MQFGHSADPALRLAASTGGALSALLVHLIETGEVDEVLQTGADPALPIANRSTCSRTPAEVLANAGSRYAPSAPLADLEPLLASERRFAFVGKPCDVAGLRALAARDSRVEERFPYVLSFFCAGVPSLSGAREVLAHLGVAEADLSGFRYRGDGWPGHATATRRDGRKARMSYADSWGGILSRHVQFRCKICPDGTGGFADVVCADAWETDEKGYPVFAERDGVSLVVARTARGMALVRSAASASALVLSPFDPAALTAIQPGQTQKRRYLLARLLALVLLRRPVPRYRGFHLVRNARHAGLRANLRNLLGTLRRGLLGRL
jgi:coenzyme F420 hydrogenase subunit beta